MMMDCPRCGFSQPKDRYCASCGLDVEHYHAKPAPIWIRVLQNPNFHLSLIAILIVFVIGYILYSRSEIVTREVGHLLGSPLTSRQAGSANGGGHHEALKETPKATGQPEKSAAAPTPPVGDAATAQGAVASPGTGAGAVAGGSVASESTPDPQKVDVGFWEVSRETLSGLIATAEKVGETNEGRAYAFKDGSKVAETIRNGSRRLTLNRSAALQAGSQIMVVTPASTPEPFQFGLAVQVTKFENKEASLRWDSQLVLGQPETAQEMASPNPSMKTVIEATLNGSSSLGPSGLVMLVIEPVNRHPREEYLAKAGDGPWSIFSSEDFKNGVSDWVVMIQLK